MVHVVTCELSGDSATIYELLDEAKIKAEKMSEEYKIEVSKNNILLDILTTQGDAAKIIIDLSKI